ncbi:GH16994 [Drosophila grimshawi]|uniref:GH16994 n=1 Tax=Drosophila grimshawi TaxID=7222 RepID=B4JU63_DROGR|nr:GH16994 [Drosophila grimshawi]
MFTIDLKALIQLSKSGEGKLQQRQRIRRGKRSYILCYVLQNGLLTINRTKRIKTGSTEKRWSRLQRHRKRFVRCPTKSCGSQTSFEICETQAQDQGSQTPLIMQTDAVVQTLDIKQMISRHQQTNKHHQLSIGSQTRRLMVDTRFTQIEQQMKVKWTQTEPQPILTSVSSTQTLAIEKLPCRNSYTQTTMPQDVEELMKPHEKTHHLLLEALNKQSNWLEHGIESIDHLVEFKILELEKQRHEALSKLNVQKRIKQLYINRRKHRRCLQIYRRRFKTKAKPAHGPEQKQTQTKEAMQKQTEPTPTGIRLQEYRDSQRVLSQL